MADAPARNIHITLSGGYWFQRLGTLIDQVMPLLTLDQPAIVTVDLRGLTGIGPSALALLTAAVVRPIYLDGSAMYPPRNPLVHAYLQRMDLIELFAPGAAQEKFKRRKPDGFRPCQHFSDEKQAVSVARELTNALCEKADLDDVAMMSVTFALSELADNVAHHAASPNGGYAVAQHFRKRDMFEIAIVDLGIGIRASLTKNPEYAHIDTDLDALTTAVKPKVTATPERNAGLGLFVTSALLTMNGGYFDLRSGKAVVTMGASNTETVKKADFPGTLATLRVRTDRPLNIKRVYRAFKDTIANADD